MLFCQGEGHTISCSLSRGVTFFKLFTSNLQPPPPLVIYGQSLSFPLSFSRKFAGKLFGRFKSGESSGVVIVRNTLARSLGNATLTQRVYNITIISLT